MGRVSLIANERFYYNGRNVEQGEQFDAEEADVSLLTHSVSPRARIPDPEPKQAASYQRRDLEAEDS